MLSREDILSYLSQHKAELLTEFQLAKIGIFGSFAQNTQTKDSDIDIIIEFNDNVSDISDKKSAMRTLFEQRFKREVDICREKYIKPYYKEQIIKTAVYV